LKGSHLKKTLWQNPFFGIQALEFADFFKEKFISFEKKERKRFSFGQDSCLSFLSLK